MRPYQPITQRIYFLARRVEVRRGPSGALHAEALMERGGAMVTTPHGNATRVEQLHEVVRVHAVDRERDGAATVNSLLRAENTHEIKIAKQAEA